MQNNVELKIRLYRNIFVHLYTLTLGPYWLFILVSNFEKFCIYFICHLHIVYMLPRIYLHYIVTHVHIIYYNYRNKHIFSKISFCPI